MSSKIFLDVMLECLLYQNLWPLENADYQISGSASFSKITHLPFHPTTNKQFTSFDIDIPVPIQ